MVLVCDARTRLRLPAPLDLHARFRTDGFVPRGSGMRGNSSNERLGRGRVLALAAAGWALCGGAAWAEVHAVMVGVGDYKYSAAHLKDLNGPPNDVKRLTAVFQQRYGLKPANTTVLVSEQATRDGVLGALAEAVRRAKPGDQLIFYYSGHGIQYGDASSDDADGRDEALLPHDGGGPEGPKQIVDDEIRVLISAAVKRGVSVVTIFDSCNSGSATRGPGLRQVAVRAAELGGLKAPAPNPAVQALSAETGAPAGSAYAVHLAAALDGQQAIEAEVDGLWRGDFTDALIATLTNAPAGVTYKDVMADVRGRLTAFGTDQTPRAEGELNRRFLGQDTVERRVFDAVSAEGVVTLKAGRLGGVHPGATYALYASARDAIDEAAKPLATATVIERDDFSAKLKLSGNGAALPERLQARETARGYEPNLVRVQFLNASPVSRSGLTAKLKPLSFVQVVEDGPHYGIEEKGGTLTLLDSDRRTVASFPAADQARLADTLRKLAQHHALLNLPAGGGAPALELTLKKAACADEGCNAATPMAGEVERGADGEVVARGKDVMLVQIRNTGSKPLYPHLVYLGHDYSISPVWPPQGDAEGALRPGRSLTIPYPLRFDEREARDHLLLIGAEAPLDLSVLEQDAVKRSLREVQPADPLGRLLDSAMSGTRGAPAAADAAWSAGLVTLRTVR